MIDLGKNTTAKPYPKPSCNNDPEMRAMRNIIQNYTGKAITIGKIKKITTTENRRFFAYFYIKNT